MSTTTTPDRFTTLPHEQTLGAAVTALEEHGFSVEVVEDARAQAYGQHSTVGKIREMHLELPGHIHIVPTHQLVGF